MKRNPLHYGWVIVLSGFLTVLGAHGFGRFAYSLILLPMKVGLNLDYFQMGLIATGNFIGYLTLATLGGLLASRYGSRIVISLSALLMGATMILTGFSVSFEHAFFARLFTGLGNGGAYLPAMALPSIWFASKLRGRATGVVSAGIGVGFALSGLIVPLILRAYEAEGWRYAWYYLGATLLVIALIDYALLRNKPEDLGLKPVGAGQSSSGGPSSTASSLRWSLVYKNWGIWLVGFIYFMYGFSYIIYVTFFAAYLQTLGWTQEVSGSLWFMVGILSILSGIIWGWVSDVLGRKYGMALAYVALTFSYLLFGVTVTTPGLYLSAIIFGISAWSLPTVAVVAAADYVSPELRSAAAGFVTLFFGIGQAIGPTIGGYVIEATRVFGYSFLIAALGSLIGAVGSLMLRKPTASGT
ncbi:MAG: MFS transporter [Candidatus Nezhaarchaeales archaeon]